MSLCFTSLYNGHNEPEVHPSYPKITTNNATCICASADGTLRGYIFFYNLLQRTSIFSLVFSVLVAYHCTILICCSRDAYARFASMKFPKKITRQSKVRKSVCRKCTIIIIIFRWFYLTYFWLP